MPERPLAESGSGTGSADVAVRTVHTGSVYIDRALAFRESTLHPVPYTGWFRANSKKLWVPVSAYLIDHPDGLVLVDTGWHADVRASQRAHLGLLPSTMFEASLPPGAAIHEQLEALGVAPADLEYVVLTHLDSDHASGVRHVADAANVVVSQPEWEERGALRYVQSMWDGVEVTPLELAAIPYGPHELGVDLFGDGRVYLVFTPGHSVGQVSVLVATGLGWVLLASDVGYAAASWEEGLLPGLTDDDAEARASLEWVGAFAGREDCVAALANHDRAVVPGEVRPAE